MVERNPATQPFAYPPFYPSFKARYGPTHSDIERQAETGDR